MVFASPNFDFICPCSWLYKDSDNFSSAYDELDITNEQDLQIKDELNRLESSVGVAYKTENRNDLNLAIKKYDELISKTGNQSPRAAFQKAETLNYIAQIERSNLILQQAISGFHSVLSMGSVVPDKLFKMAGNRCVNLLKFRGWYDKAIDVQKIVISRFPNIPDEINKLGTLFLYVNKNSEAKIVFEQLLKQFPNDGYALVHLGFILKLEGSANEKGVDDNSKFALRQLLTQGAEYLQKGIKTRELGTTQGKFYFHLGDALRRLGKTMEADKVYKEAAEEGAMLSFWQRSLYNVEGLKAKPVWMLEETGISDHLVRIRQNWELIRNEALSALKRNLYQSEGENLRDTGKWAQFELYRQGRKNERNCKKAPITCNLIDSIPQVATNRRGQVKFSVMEAGTHVHAHSGPTNCRLRAHLGLQIPENSSSSIVPSKSSTKLRVADEHLVWHDGELFIFDDSYDHEVWHDNPQGTPRIVLIFDIWHPELTEEQKRTLPAI